MLQLKDYIKPDIFQLPKFCKNRQIISLNRRKWYFRG